MSSTMSEHSPKAAIPIEQKLRYPNAEHGTRNFKLFNLSFNADMSSTMSGHSPKVAIPIEQKLRYANAERGTRNTKLQTSNSSNFL